MKCNIIIANKVVSITVYTMGIASLFVRRLEDNNKATTIISQYLPFLNIFQVFTFFQAINKN